MKKFKTPPRGPWAIGSLEAAPALLDLAKTLKSKNLRTRALHGYIRLAIQMDMPTDERLEMFDTAFRAAQRNEERRIALQALARCPSAKALTIATSHLGQEGLRDEAVIAAESIAERLIDAEPQVVAPAMRQVLQTGVVGPLAGHAGRLLVMAAPNPQSLFDGRTFQGWEGDTKNYFRIEQGAIVGGSMKEKVPHNAFLCTTKSYANFILRVECKLLGPANGGVQIRSQRVPNNFEVAGYQADMDAGPSGGLWGSLYDESRRNRTLVKPDKSLLTIVKAEDWNQYEIRCEGPRVRLYVNGVLTVDYTEKDRNLKQSGIIGLQIHGGPPSEAWYRNIVIQELP